MKHSSAAVLLAVFLSACGGSASRRSYDPTSIEAANGILAASGLPTIPDGTNAKAYSWSFMAAGVFAKFDYSSTFMDKFEDDLVAFNQSERLPQTIENLGIQETRWFTPTAIEDGHYLIKDLSGDDGTPESFIVVVDADRTMIYLAYSWN